MAKNDKKLLVQIPTLNEEENIKDVMESIPRTIEGLSRVDVLIIDDASTDATVQIARAHGVDFVLQKPQRRGLADSFNVGTQFALIKGYDYLVNTDGDNQYFQEKIPLLVEKALAQKSDLVIGDRDTATLQHFGFLKKIFQKIGSRFLSAVAGVKIPDAASGFRLYSARALAQINVTTSFSYAMETIIQAGQIGLKIDTVTTGAKKVNRPSRLFKSPIEHVVRSGTAILRGLLMYKPLGVFLWASAIVGFSGLVPFIRYLVLVSNGTPGEHLQSLILGVVLIGAAFTTASLALVADTQRTNRLVLEDILCSKKLELREIEPFLIKNGLELS